jgi:hypothetical protein
MKGNLYSNVAADLRNQYRMPQEAGSSFHYFDVNPNGNAASAPLQLQMAPANCIKTCMKYQSRIIMS